MSRCVGKSLPRVFGTFTSEQEKGARRKISVRFDSFRFLYKFYLGDVGARSRVETVDCEPEIFQSLPKCPSYLRTDWCIVQCISDGRSTFFLVAESRRLCSFASPFRVSVPIGNGYCDHINNNELCGKLYDIPGQNPDVARRLAF